MTDRAIVACGTCRACCRGEKIVLIPEDGDKVDSYLTETIAHPLTGQWVYALKQKPNGECFYLGEAGCTIHERAPVLCRSFDCAGFYRRELERLKELPRPQRRRATRTMMKSDVLQAGKARAGGDEV